MKWRATFSVFDLDNLTGEWVRTNRQITRVVEAENYDNAVVCANAMAGEELDYSGKLGNLMFIAVAENSASLSENCSDLQFSFKRTAEKLSEKNVSFEYVLDGDKIAGIKILDFFFVGREDS